ncbi:TPR repeat [Prochlorococcus marinus str. MIT 9313]|uniref:TPR repeat n=1 Tax=Prochlorococcus marinus (strain MIT 9313) TaxID=74547 RepID=Q7V4X5_PROMM|nr:tetratricopeptide repeat protein [Prochlorococcus marinus]CAE21985.1 TPR repeat [Prochlorococcus marinus str. MIT 9313]
MNPEEIIQQQQAAVKAYQSKDLDAAEAICIQILSVNPKEPNSLHLLGCIYKDRGNLQQAFDLIQASIREDDSTPIPFINLGNILVMVGQHEEAARIFQQSLQRNQQIPESWFCFGNALREIGNVQEAKQAYRNTLQLNAAHAGAASILGALLADEEKLDESEEIFSKAIEASPQDVNLRINYGKLLEDKYEYNAALEQYRFALLLAPESPELHLNFASALKKEGKVEEAIASCRNAIELRPDFEAAYFGLGIVLKENGEFEEAKASYRKAIDLKPDFADAYLNLGHVFKDHGEAEEAKASYRTAIDLKPDFADAYLNLGNILKEEGDVEEAIASYRKAIELKPDFVDAYLNLGTVLNDEGEVEEARQIVSALYNLNVIEESSLLVTSSSNLVLDWHQRKVLNLSLEVESASLFYGFKPFSAFEVVKTVDAWHFPPLFLKGEGDRANEKHLYRNGYLVEDEILPEDLCAEFVNGFEGANAMSAALIRAVSEKGVLGSVLGKIFKHTDFPHLVWNCIYFAKGPDDQAISDAWHYDNHYNVWTPKLMIYLNSQREEGGATEFVDASLSRRLSEETDYMGLIWQRESYADRVKGSVKDLGLDPATLDPDHYTFSPDHAGSGVWFCPSRVLHRGVSPKKGVRHVLSFSLTPLPHDCGWSIDQCVDKSIEILQDKINKGMQKSDVNPYWIPAEAGYA